MAARCAVDQVRLELGSGGRFEPLEERVIEDAHDEIVAVLVAELDRGSSRNAPQDVHQGRDVAEALAFRKRSHEPAVRQHCSDALDRLVCGPEFCGDEVARDFEHLLARRLEQQAGGDVAERCEQSPTRERDDTGAERDLGADRQRVNQGADGGHGGADLIITDAPIVPPLPLAAHRQS
jgi:hypothetical protein